MTREQRPNNVEEWLPLPTENRVALAEHRIALAIAEYELAVQMAKLMPNQRPKKGPLGI